MSIPEHIAITDLFESWPFVALQYIKNTKFFLCKVSYLRSEIESESESQSEYMWNCFQTVSTLEEVKTFSKSKTKYCWLWRGNCLNPANNYLFKAATETENGVKYVQS